MAKAYHRRPSEIYGIQGEFRAWCFDRAVWLFGSELSAELRDATKDAKNDGQARQRSARVLARWGIGSVQYRDPAAGAAVKQGEPGKTGEVVSSETASGPVSL